MLNLVNHEPDVDKIYLYAKDPYKAKYQLLINKKESINTKYLNDSKALLNTQRIWMDDIYENKKEYNPNKKRKNIDHIWWYVCWYA